MPGQLVHIADGVTVKLRASAASLTRLSSRAPPA